MPSSTGYQTYQVGATKATQVVYGSGSDPQHSIPGMLVNNDLTRTAILGDFGVNTSETNTSTIQPLQAISVDGTKDIHAITASGVVSLTFMPGVEYWAPSPQQTALSIAALGLATATNQVTQNNTATSTNDVLGSGIAIPIGAAADTTVSALQAGIPNNIAIAGVPLLTKSTLIQNLGTTALGIGATSTEGPFTISQIGYEIFLSIWCPGNVLSFFDIEFQWFDSGTGILVGNEHWWVIPGTGVGTPHTIIGVGPTKGDQLKVIITNSSGSTASVSCSYTLLQNSRIYNSDRWRTISLTAAGLQSTGGVPSSGVLASSNIMVAAGSDVTRVLPLMNGEVGLTFSTGSNTSDADLNIINLATEPGGVALPNQTVYHSKTNAVGEINNFYFQPRGQCQAVLTNNNAGNQPFGLSIIAGEQIVI